MITSKELAMRIIKYESGSVESDLMAIADTWHV